MDILYIHPAKQEVEAEYGKYRASPFYPIIPVGVIGLANLLRSQGWSLEGLNLPLERMLDTGFQLERWLQEVEPPSLVMIDLHWYEHCFGAVDVARHVRRLLPNSKIVAGGLTATYFAEEILTTHPEFDFIIRGDAEVPLATLVDQVCGDAVWDPAGVPNLTWREGDRVRNSTEFYTADGPMLDSLDFVGLDWLAHGESYGALQYTGGGHIDAHRTGRKGHWLTIGRGCAFNCIYCGGSKEAHTELAARSGYVMRDPVNVVDDVEQLAASGYKQVSLSLDPATFPARWWRTFFGELQTRDIRIGIYNEFFQLPSQEFIRLLGETADLEHTEVAISPLSGNEEVRNLNGKHYSNERFLKMLGNLEHYQIPIFVYFSLNLPGETVLTFRETIRLAKAVGKAYPARLLRMLNPCHTIDPMSPMSRLPGNFKIHVEYNSFKDYYEYCRTTGWEPREVVRGERRGFSMAGRPAETVEQMARIWDGFAQTQRFQCFPVARVW